MDDSLAKQVAHALGDELVSWRSTSGGDINAASVLRFRHTQEVFVKTPPTGRRFPSDLYSAEASGLRWLAQANAMRVPRVLGVDATWLALEFVPHGCAAADHDEQLGRNLAALHRFGADGWGYPEDNYIGSLPQSNALQLDWPTFYAEQRLLPQLERARPQVGRALAQRLDRLCQRMASYVSPEEAPSRLHGDLWAGNVFPDLRGQPVLIDPAVYGGHREVDLAMMQLFGGFSDTVFAAYQEAFPLAPHWRDRMSLYQLYPLLVHVNLFGAGYVRQLQDALSAAGG